MFELNSTVVTENIIRLSHYSAHLHSAFYPRPFHYCTRSRSLVSILLKCTQCTKRKALPQAVPFLRVLYEPCIQHQRETSAMPVSISADTDNIDNHSYNDYIKHSILNALSYFTKSGSWLVTRCLTYRTWIYNTLFNRHNSATKSWLLLNLHVHKPLALTTPTDTTIIIVTPLVQWNQLHYIILPLSNNNKSTIFVKCYFVFIVDANTK